MALVILKSVNIRNL